LIVAIYVKYYLFIRAVCTYVCIFMCVINVSAERYIHAILKMHMAII